MTETGHRLILQARPYFDTTKAWADAMGLTDSSAYHYINNDPGNVDYSSTKHSDEDVLNRLMAGVFERGESQGFKRGVEGEWEVPPEEEYHSDGKTLHTVRNVGEPIYSIDDAKEFFDVDEDRWSAVDLETSMYEGPVTTKRSETMDVEGTERMYSEKVAHKVRYYRINVEWERDGARETVCSMVDRLLEGEDVAKDAPDTQTLSGDVAAAIHIPDLHLGNIIYREDGSTEWDLDTAAEAFRTAYETLLQNALDRGACHLILPIGSDAAQSNSSLNQSANGTPFAQVAPAPLCSRRMKDEYEYAIERAVELGLSVLVVAVGGNHDWDPALAMGDCMNRLFRDWGQVSVDCRLTPYKIHRWGTNLIGLTHGKNKDGNLLSAQDPYEIMADRAGADWAGTTTKEWLTGHLHSRDAETVGDYTDYNDVTVRISPTLCPPDAWHLNSGYTGALRGAEGRYYHFDEGMIGMDHYVHQP